VLGRTFRPLCGASSKFLAKESCSSFDGERAFGHTPANSASDSMLMFENVCRYDDKNFGEEDLEQVELEDALTS
jgi:hypothetical protein